MPIRTLAGAVIALVSLTFPLVGQNDPPELRGTWKAETADGPHEIIVREDSSASFGDEVVRWRLVADSIFIALGNEWLVYNFVVDGSRLTLSGGDLVDPIMLERIGPPTPRPDGVPVPPAPPMNRRAWTEPEAS